MFDRFKLIRLIESESDCEASNRFFRRLLFTARLLMHIILFILVMASGVLSKLSLLLMTSQLGDYSLASVQPANASEHQNTMEEPRMRRTDVTSENAKSWLWPLLLSICLPHVAVIAVCLSKIMFRHVPNPSLALFTMVRCSIFIFIFLFLFYIK